MESEAVRAKSHGATEYPDLYRLHEERLSPAYLKPEEGIWDQSYLSRVLQQMKDSEIQKLRLPPGCNKPLEYERWFKI